MPRKRRYDLLKERARELKYAFLKKQGGLGGKPAGFIAEATDWASDPGNAEWLKSLHLELWLNTCQQTWGEKLGHADPDQIEMFVDGDPLPLELKYRAMVKDEVSGQWVQERDHTTVLIDYASVKHVRFAYLEEQENAFEVAAAAERMRKIYQRLLLRAGGNEDARVIDLLGDGGPDLPPPFPKNPGPRPHLPV